MAGVGGYWPEERIEGIRHMSIAEIRVWKRDVEVEIRVLESRRYPKHDDIGNARLEELLRVRGVMDYEIRKRGPMGINLKGGDRVEMPSIFGIIKNFFSED